MPKFMKDLIVYLLAMHIKKAKTATFYNAPDAVIRITEFGKWRKREPSLDFRITLGRPNYEASQFIKLCQRAGEKFPVKKVQYKFRKPKAKRVKVSTTRRRPKKTKI